MGSFNSQHSFNDAEKEKMVTNHFKPGKGFVFPTTFFAGKNRRFNPAWLEERSWLRYSNSQDGGYCLPCAIFGNRQKKDSVFVNKPFRDFHRPFERFDAHQGSDMHVNAVILFTNYMKTLQVAGQTIIAKLSSAHLELITENTRILETFAEAAHFLGKQGLAFRGNRDDSTSTATNKGNFVELINYTASVSQDKVLQNHLKSAPKNALYTSKTIQNELIEILGGQIRKNILDKVSSSKYYSLLADEVTDAANEEKLCVCIRFFDDFEKSVQEEFMEFAFCPNITGENLAAIIEDLLRKWGLNLCDMRGQGYDGAANMSSCRKGVSGRILQKNPKALYTHCSSHRLNLMIVSASKLPVVRDVVDVIGELSRFFKYSPKRQQCLSSVILKHATEAKKLKLKDAAQTRWIQRHEAYETFLELYPYLRQVLEEMSTVVGYDRETSTKSYGFLRSITSSAFLVAVTFICEVMAVIKPVTVKLQKRSIDIVTALAMVADLKQELTEMRTEHRFSQCFQAAKSLASVAGTEITKPRIASHQQQRHNHDMPNVEDYFRVSLYNTFMDQVLQELDQRFLATSNRHVLSSLVPKCLIQKSVEELNEVLLELIDFYYGDIPFPSTLFSEVARWRKSWLDASDVPENAVSVLVRCDRDIFPNSYDLLKILAVLPVSTCEVVRCNSKLKIVKSCLRVTMGDERMSNLILMKANPAANIRQVIFYGAM